MTLAAALRRESEPAPMGAGALADRDLVFCDSRAVLERALEEGLAADVEIRTSSPALLQDGRFRCAPLERAGEGPDTYRLGRELRGLGDALHRAFGEREELRTYALLAAQATLNFQRELYKAQQLREADEGRRIAHLGVAASGHADLVLNGFWPLLLADHPDAAFRRYDLPASLDVGSAHQHADFFERLRLTGLPRIGYRLALKAWRRLPQGLARGTVLVLRENELARETAFALAQKGYAIRELPGKWPNAGAPSAERRAALQEAIAPLLEPLLARRLARWVRPALLQRFVDEVAGGAERYDACRPFWRRELGRFGDGGRRVVLTNMFNLPETLALRDACSDEGVELVSAQHGVTTEITDIGDHAYWIEPVNSHLFLAFNEAGAEKGRDNPPSRAECVAVGMPLDYHRIGRLRRRAQDAPPILYASTALYIANVQQPSRHSVSDPEKAEFEGAIVDEALGGLPHRVRYKTYPERRYLDADPVTERARRQPNIELFDARLDLRFLLNECRVVVTSRATSTLGWCLMSGKPLVFIDVPGGMALDGPARAALEPAIFLFDAGEAGWRDRLRTFLAQPLEQIEAAYAARAGARREAVARFFSAGGPGAGRRAADLLHARMTRRGSV